MLSRERRSQQAQPPPQRAAAQQSESKKAIIKQSRSSAIHILPSATLLRPFGESLSQGQPIIDKESES